MKTLKSKIFPAFTLAEVLIVLGIIGIIAELTIPDLIKNTQNAEIIVGKKKAISVFSQAASLLLTNSGMSDLSGYFPDSTATTATADDANAFRDQFGTVMKFVKTCDSGKVYSGGCVNTYIIQSSNIHANDDADWGASYSAAVLSDGMIVIFNYSHPGCTYNYGGWGEETNPMYANLCGDMTIDVNGNRGPNKTGKDIFMAVIKSNGTIRPYNSGDDECTKSTNCAACWASNANYLNK